MDAENTHLMDQLSGYDRDMADRLAKFYRRLRTGGVPPIGAALAMVVQLIGHHFSPPIKDD